VQITSCTTGALGWDDDSSLVWQHVGALNNFRQQLWELTIWEAESTYLETVEGTNFQFKLAVMSSPVGFIFFLPTNFSTCSSVQNIAALRAIPFQPFNTLANSFLMTDWNGVYQKKYYLGCHQILAMSGKTHNTLRKIVSLQRSWAKLFGITGTETQPTHPQKCTAEGNKNPAVSRKEQLRAVTPYQSFKMWKEHEYSHLLQLAN